MDSSSIGSSPVIAALLERIRSLSQFQLISEAQQLLQLDELDEAVRLRAIPTIASALNSKYEITGEWDFNEQAIEYLQEAIEATSEEDLELAADISDVYSRCMQARFLRGRADGDMEQAVEFAETAVSFTETMISAADAERAEVLKIKLARRLCSQSERYFARAHHLLDSDQAQLERAVECCTQALRLLDEENSAEHREVKLIIWSTIGLELQVTYDKTDYFIFLEQSLNYGTKTLELVSSEERDARHECLANQAFRLQRAYKHFMVHGDVTGNAWLDKRETLFQDALTSMEDAMSIEVDGERQKLANILTFVRDITILPADVQGSALAACSQMLSNAVRAMADTAVGMLRHDRRDMLSTFSGLSRCAAAAALEAGEPPWTALDLLEQGRTVALSLRLENSRDLEELKQLDVNSAERYMEIKKGLSSAENATESYEERQRLVQELREIQIHARRNLGLVGFDAPISESSAIAMAGDDHVVVVNITDIRSDAITISRKGVQSVQLPLLKEEDVSEKSWEIQRLLFGEFDESEIFPGLWGKLSDLLSSLWKTVARPILNQLGLRTRPADDGQWPRVCWILTGPLSMYPIHAAGTGLQTDNNVMSRAISSYAVSLKGLVQSHAAYQQVIRSSDIQNISGLSSNVTTGSETTPLVGVVVMPSTPGKSDLPFCLDEAAVIESVYSPVKVLKSPSYDEVVEMFEEGIQLLHLSCHGEVDFVDPAQSHFLLSDWSTNPLTVKAIQGLGVRKRQVAVLSACFTANAGVENEQDEAEHLVSALQTAGFGSVVGSLWYVGEEAAFAVMKRFYQRLRWGAAGMDARELAQALHFAILEYRETTRSAGNDMKGNPVAWAPFVCFGGVT